ncbi:MAG: 30S ribosomal protein S2, partial [Candidatus Pacearchaeota archaeon]|nr:30S ribosomal protein S2 [Candidatus Pacearchaeota archaeon]
SLKEELEERMKTNDDNSKKPKIKDISKDEEKQIEEASEKISKKDIAEEKKSISSKEETLIPLEDYIKCAVHLGTKVITPNMKKFVYKRRADGLAVINTILIDQKLREAIELLIQYESKNIYLCCKREAGWEAARKFEELTGIRVFTKKYSPGITTNLELEDFFEAELTIICDPWIDKNALNDTIKLKKPIISLCDTNNYTQNITNIIPCNNKSAKSIGCILYILAREYNKAKGKEFTAKLEDFTGPLE